LALSSETRDARRRHLADAAQTLIREQGDAGFSMTQLALRAGVSPATPYNLLGSKAEILRRVVREDFARFITRLEGLRRDRPLAYLLQAADLVVGHYEADRRLHQGLFRAAYGAEAAAVRDVMSAEGRALWRGFVEAAVEAGELARFVEPRPLTDVLLRAMGATAHTWLADGWSRARFELEMAMAVRLILASVSASPHREAMAAEIAQALAAIAALGAPSRPIPQSASEAPIASSSQAVPLSRLPASS
jgi:AcrR family transcriptional regulator